MGSERSRSYAGWHKEIDCEAGARRGEIVGPEVKQPVHSNPRWVSRLALLIGGLLFIPLCAFGLLSTFGIDQNPLGGCLLVLSLLFGRLVVDPTRYAVASVLIVGLILVAVMWERPRAITLSLLLLPVLSIVGTPFLYHYQPPVTAAPGRQIIIPTHRSMMDGFIGRVQELTEVTPCHYQILGWTASGALVYQEVNGSIATQTFAFDPSSSDGPRALGTEVPALASDQPQVSIREALWSQDGTTSTIAGPVQGTGVQSPDGQWAAVVESHPYGPEDVVLVRLE
ncbi:MAG: hypothetical protein ACUVX1_17845, partial [Chloroflexota bacterium]